MVTNLFFLVVWRPESGLRWLMLSGVQCVRLLQVVFGFYRSGSQFLCLSSCFMNHCVFKERAVGLHVSHFQHIPCQPFISNHSESQFLHHAFSLFFIFLYFFITCTSWTSRLYTTVVADEIWNNQLDVCKQPSSPL